MDIACPNCAAAYRVPDALLAQGKALRCAACDHSWVPEPVPVPVPVPLPAPMPPPLPPMPSAPAPEDVMMVAEAAAPLPEATPRPAPPKPPPPTSPPPLHRPNIPGFRSSGGGGGQARPVGRMLSLAWVVSVALVLMALLAMVIFADGIAAAWPPFQRVTGLLGG